MLIITKDVIKILLIIFCVITFCIITFIYINKSTFQISIFLHALDLSSITKSFFILQKKFYLFQDHYVYQYGEATYFVYQKTGTILTFLYKGGPRNMVTSLACIQETSHVSWLAITILLKKYLHDLNLMGNQGHSQHTQELLEKIQVTIKQVVSKFLLI